MTFLDVYTPRGFAVLVVPGEWGVAARQMRKHAVVVSGVCAASFKDRQIHTPARILLAQLPKRPPIPIEPPGGPDAPPRMIDTLLDFVPDPHPGARRVKIAGVVTAAPLPDLLTIQDSSGGALVVVANPPTEIPVGARVEAYGYLQVEGRRISLTQATMKELGGAKLPTPVSARANELAPGARDAVRVQMHGRAEDVRELDGWTVVTLSDDGTRFEAYIPGSPEHNQLDKLEVGSRISVVGIPVDVTPDHKAPTVPGMFFHDREAFVILEPPPPLQGQAAPLWWTTARVGYAIGGFAMVFVLGRLAAHPAGPGAAGGQ